jgi:hypothetical protein
VLHFACVTFLRPQARAFRESCTEIFSDLIFSGTRRSKRALEQREHCFTGLRGDGVAPNNPQQERRNRIRGHPVSVHRLARHHLHVTTKGLQSRKAQLQSDEADTQRLSYNCKRGKDNWISGKADWKKENANQNSSGKDGWKFVLSRSAGPS